MITSSQKQKLEKVARWYSSSKGLNAFMIYCVFKEIRNYIKEPLLEIGAADGYMTNLITRHIKISNYDIVEASLRYCKFLTSRFKNINIINTFFENYGTKKEYKTIIASHILEHIEFVDPFLKKIYDSLSDDGIFLVSVPNALSFHRLIGVEMGLLATPHQLNAQDRKIGHFRVYDMESLIKDLEKNHFKIRVLTGSFIKFMSNEQVEKSIPKKNWRYYYYLSKQFPKYCSDIIAICYK